MEFVGLVGEVRARVRWGGEAGEWLPSLGAGGAVPWSWAALELARALRAYPGGLAPALLRSELQRRWRDAAHRFSRSMARPIQHHQQDVLLHHHQHQHQHQHQHLLSWDAVLEARLRLPAPPLASSSSLLALDQRALLAQLVDWRGGRLDWYVHNKLLSLLSSGLLPPGEPLLRLTGLRTFHVRSSSSSSSSSSREVARLLPTELFTVLVTSLEELAFIRDGSQGCMWGRVLDVGKADVGATGLVILLEVQNEKRRLLLHENQVAFASLVKPNDTLLLLDPVVGRAPGIVEMSPLTVICQHSHDPLLHTDGGGAVEDMISRVERTRLADLLIGPARNATVLLLVTGIAEPLHQGVVLRVWDESVEESIPLYCWGEHGVESAKLLQAGEWVLMQGLLSKKGKEDHRLSLHCESDAWGSRVAGSLPLAGLLASPGLWRPVLSLDEAVARPGGGPVSGVDGCGCEIAERRSTCDCAFG
jgi:hypothetical protein